MADLLLIDNDRRLVELVGLLLTRQGHTVRTVGSFAAAREELARRRPDLMLSDLELGAENGRNELPRLAQEGLLPPTLVVSGFLDAELTAELSAVPGVLATLAKPFDLERLSERIDACLAAEHTAQAAAAVRQDPLSPPRPLPPRGGGTLL